MKTVQGLSKALGGRYDGPTKEIRGMTYIPWNEAVKTANAVFDTDGYDVTVKAVRREGDGFMAIVAVTVFTSDGRAVTRENVGFNDIQTTQGGKELIDTAIKGAVSDAINRALKLFGDAFGLYLYDKDEQPTPASASRSSSAPARSSANGGKRSGPTDKQVEWLVKKNVVATEEEAREMTFEEAKAALDEAFGGSGSRSQQARTQATARRVGTPDDDEQLPF